MACAYWHPLQLFHCLPPSAQSNLLERSRNCEAGCYACDDNHETLGQNIGVNEHGTRWLRPSKSLESRDAWGRFHFMAAAEPWLLSQNAIYEMALCYEQPGRELWTKRLCDCHSWSHCPPGSHWWQEVRFTPIPTCSWATGALWNPTPATYPRCTGNAETHRTDPVRLSFSGDGLWFEGESLTPAFVRHWVPPAQAPASSETPGVGENYKRWSWCAGNMLVLCCGHVPVYQHLDCNAHGLFQYYLDLNYSNQMWHLWDYAEITGFDGTFRVRSDLLQDTGALAAKNAALQYLSEHMVELGLAQLENPRRTASPFENWNSELNRFSAIFDSGGDEDDEPGPVVHTFPNSYLRRGRQRVSAEYRVVRATIELEVIPYRIKSAGFPAGGDDSVWTPEQLRAVFPYSRGRAELHMGTTATMLDPFAGTVDGGGHSGSERSQRFPTVSPADDIVYVDADGRTVVPPARVLWMGNLGAFSDPVHEDVFNYEYQNLCGGFFAVGSASECCAIAHGLRELTVPAWPTDIDARPTDRSGLWSGSLQVKFPNFNLFCRPNTWEGVPCIGPI